MRNPILTGHRCEFFFVKVSWFASKAGHKGSNMHIGHNDCIAANLPTCLPIYLQHFPCTHHCFKFHTTSISYVYIHCINVYIYIYTWLFEYIHIQTHLLCPHVHWFIKHSWFGFTTGSTKTTSQMARWHSLLETNPTCDTSGTCWARNDSLASPAKAASVASDQASCQRTILPDWRLMDDLMTDGEWCP